MTKTGTMEALEVAANLVEEVVILEEVVMRYLTTVFTLLAAAVPSVLAASPTVQRALTSEMVGCPLCTCRRPWDKLCLKFEDTDKACRCPTVHHRRTRHRPWCGRATPVPVEDVSRACARSSAMLDGLAGRSHTVDAGGVGGCQLRCRAALDALYIYFLCATFYALLID